jgi:hypothetical protein
VSTRGGQAYAVEDFLQALSSQLDRAQDALALKARTGRPLTFALKDMSVELKVFWEVQSDGRLTLRHAAPNEAGASTVNFAFTTITRAMVEENTIAITADEDPRTIDELGDGDGGFDAGDRYRLGLVGVRTVGQFKRLMQGADPRAMEGMLGTPVDRLRAALVRSAETVVTGNEVVERPDGRQLLRIRGANFLAAGKPKVRLAGEPVEVLEARANELVVRPLAHHVDGQLEVHTGGRVAEGFFELPRGATPPAPANGIPKRAPPDPYELQSEEP